MSEASRSAETEPQLETVDAFTVVGRRVRTSNADESDPARGRLPALWHEFLAEGGLEGAPGRDPDSAIFGVYSAYEDAGHGLYDVTAAVKQQEDADLPEGYVKHEVPGGQYLVFTGYGVLPDMVIETWARIWAWFAEDRPYARTFTTDFEMHDEVGVVDIFIAVKPS